MLFIETERASCCVYGGDAKEHNWGEVTNRHRLDSAFCFGVVHCNGTETETANEGNDHLLVDVSVILRLSVGIFPRPRTCRFGTDPSV